MFVIVFRNTFSLLFLRSPGLVYKWAASANVFSNGGDGHSLKREMVFLFVHGMLHLLGYDHMKEEDEKVMFKLQDDILGGLK